MNTVRKYLYVTTSYILVVFLAIILNVLYLKTKGGTGSVLSFNNTSLVSWVVIVGGGGIMLFTTFRLNRGLRISKLCRSVVYKLHLAVLIFALLTIIISVQTSDGISVASFKILNQLANRLSDSNSPLRFIFFSFIWAIVMSFILSINAVRSGKVKYIWYIIPYTALMVMIYFFIDL